MKKLFFIAAIASVAFASCVKNEVAPTAMQQDEITFATPVVGNLTKAQPGEIGVNYNEAEHFGVYAVHTASTLTEWSTGSLYMGTATVGLECLKEGGDNYWAPSTPYYWPKEGFLSFAAYSPFGVSGDVTYGATGLSVVGHTVSTNTAAHIDFMYAPRVYNRNSSTEEGDDDDSKYKYDGVNILFEHAMSSIVFKVARKTGIDANTVITLNKITLTDPYLKADFNETITDGATYVASPKWSNWSSEGDIVAYNSGVDLTESLVEYVNNTDDDIILIPQTLTDDVKVVLEYTITNPGGHNLDQVSEIQLNAHTSAWGMGTRYTYNITIGLDEIIFDPAVTDWNNETAIAIAI
ncbi:MAG: fimbrillin family protein [Bacteroidales bacterium]|nr:fimbrillin family protein [Bacteroidales bacterium]